ncbi:hypothetical protein PVIIG_03647 [Plasmodium vivax India VII]|uniref:Uncharacterized protein n=1 Tax=Plasmodium vivax India VII TaxID=1077284 RepID=A0A0J9SLN1_PLAVI|nr:hypothetical protein PVIIG_03647 [Plasmodium vivax India VII]
MISLYRDLLSLWRNSSCCEKNSDNRCIKNVIIEFDKELLKNKKELYDFSEYYNSVKNVWGTTKCQNAENLCKYINYVIKLYKKIRQRRHLKYNEKYINEMIILEKALVNGNDANFIKEKCPLVDINAVLNMKIKTLQMSENGEGNIILRENLESRNARKKFNDNVLNGLTEYGKYKKFNIENVEETMKNKCFKDIKKLDIKYNWAKELCGKLATYLVKLHSIDGLEGNNNDRCAYLNYWIFDQIMNITGSDDKNVIDGFVLNELNKVVYQLNNTCFYYFDGNFHEWDEEKYLHDFFKNFNEILDKTQTFNNNSQTYCDYIHHINNIYEKYLDRCCIYFYEDEPLNKCEKYFNCDQAYNPYNIYTKLYCKGDEKPEIFFKKVEQPKPIDYNVKTITKLSAGGSCNKFLCDPYYIFVLGTFMVMGTLLMLLVFNKV